MLTIGCPIGYKQTEEHIAKRLLKIRGKKRSAESIARYIIANKGTNLGRKHTIETKLKISRKLKGKNNPRYGKYKELSPAWRGGFSTLRLRLAGINKYTQWRKSVFERDNYTCQDCGNKKSYLEAHHIKSFALILKENNIKTIKQAVDTVELWDINNGLTLCKICHSKTPNYKVKISL